MKNILVPIGSSESTLNTLRYAVDLARDLNAHVFVIRAYNPKTTSNLRSIDDFLMRESDLYVNTLIKSIDTDGVSLKIVTAKGDVINNISNVSKKLHIDLIVIGKRSHDTRDDLFLGTTSAMIVKHVPTPVLIVPKQVSYQPYRRLLLITKSGIVKHESGLSPIEFIKERYRLTIDLLLVKTLKFKAGQEVLNAKLDAIKTTFKSIKSSTVFEGTKQHLAENPEIKPDLLCVFRSKKGFFEKLWRNKVVLKKDFDSDVPVLVLKILK